MFEIIKVRVNWCLSCRVLTLMVVAAVNTSPLEKSYTKFQMVAVKPSTLQLY